MSRLAAQYGAVNLSQGFPDYSPPEELLDRVAHYVRGAYHQYAPMPGVPALRQAIAQKIDRQHGIQVDVAQEITITSGATQGIYTVLSTCIRPGDEVILIEPAYDSYRPTVELNGGRVVPYRLQGPTYRVDWSAFAKLVSERTRMIVINTPHNPTGSIFEPDDWAALEQLVAGTGILLLSDEVYEHLVYDGHEHHSVLSRPALRTRSFATFSFGKTFHSTGWKIGYVVAPPDLTAEFRKLHQFTVFAVVTPLQYALADYLADPAHYESLPAFYQRKRDYLQHLLADTPLQPLPCRGTYFQLYDYSALSNQDDVAFAKWLTQEGGVATIPVSPFCSGDYDEQVVRLCFAKQEETLAEAGRRASLVKG